jgi:hypothetical protein
VALVQAEVEAVQQRMNAELVAERERAASLLREQDRLRAEAQQLTEQLARAQADTAEAEVGRTDDGSPLC